MLPFSLHLDHLDRGLFLLFDVEKYSFNLSLPGSVNVRSNKMTADSK